jgi:transposase
MQGRPSLTVRHSYSARCRVVGLMLSGLSPQVAARACGMSRSTAYRLLRRYQQSGWDGLRDRPPVAKTHPGRVSGQAEAQIVALRRQTGWGHVPCQRRWAARRRRSGGYFAGMAARGRACASSSGESA